MTAVRALAAAALLAADRAASAGAVAPGEETVMQFRYLDIPTGEGRMIVGQPSGDVWPVIFQAKTQGIAGFFDIREHLVSYWDHATGLPRGSDLRAYEVGDYHQERIRFDRLNGKANYERQRKGTLTQKTYDVPPNVHDIMSAIMWLRLQPLRPGQRHELPVFAGTDEFTLFVDVLGRETVETSAGAFPTVKLQVRTAFKGKFSTKRDTFMWLSDDPRHILVRVAGEFAIGSIVGTLKSYRPGTQVATR